MQIQLKTAEIWEANWSFFTKSGLIERQSVVTPKLPTTILLSRDTYIERALGDMNATERAALLKDKRTGKPTCQIKFIKKIGECNNENIFGSETIII